MRHLLVWSALVSVIAGCGSDESGNTTPSNAGKDAAAADSAPEVSADATEDTSHDADSEDAEEDTTADAGQGSRSFAMGLSPFPYDVTQEAVDWVYDTLATDTDLLAFHTLQGVPWVEAAEGESFDGYGSNVKTTWQMHVSRVDSDHQVYLGLTPLNDARAGLADYWGEDEHMPLPTPWDGYGFDAPEVQQAYVSFCKEAIEFYDPDYVAVGIEVNLLKANAPEKWDAFVALQKETYTQLKAVYPDLPVFVTFTAVDLLEGWTSVDHEAQLTALADVLPYTDVFALSFYPYMSAHTTNPIPDATFDDLEALAGGKPLAIAESGYPAQTTELPSYGLVFEGTEQKQEAWIARLLTEANDRQALFVVNYLARDYDALWNAIGGGDWAAVWRDTGLYDESGIGRPSHGTWMQWLDRDRVAPNR